MGKTTVFVAIIVSFILVGCRRHISDPENSDPVYLDMLRDRDKTFSKLKDAQDEVNKDQAAVESAPIRTGQRQDAMDDLFQAQHKYQSLIEQYRYLSIKAGLRKKHDKTAYEEAFKAEKPWPDLDEFFVYQTEKRLKNAPREWDPENRIKKREIASTKDKKQENEGKEE